MECAHGAVFVAGNIFSLEYTYIVEYSYIPLELI